MLRPWASGYVLVENCRERISRVEPKILWHPTARLLRQEDALSIRFDVVMVSCMAHAEMLLKAPKGFPHLKEKAEVVDYVRLSHLKSLPRGRNAWKKFLGYTQDTVLGTMALSSCKPMLARKLHPKA